MTIYFSYKLGKSEFSIQLKNSNRSQTIGFNVDIMRHIACLVVNPIEVNNFAVLFNCTTVGQAVDSIYRSNMVFHALKFARSRRPRFSTPPKGSGEC